MNCLCVSNMHVNAITILHCHKCIFVGVEKFFLGKFQENLADSTAAVAQKTRWRGLVMGSGVYIPILSFSVAIVYGVSLIAYEGVPYSTVWM